MRRRGDAEPVIKPVRAAQPAEQGEADEARNGHECQTMLHMAVLEMAELVGEHGLELVWRQGSQQGIEKHDALLRAEPGKIGVAMLLTRRAVHDVDAAARESAAVQQILAALPQRGVLERREAIEERRDEAGVRP